MSDNTQNNKRIAKNTLLLYIRMLFTMVITLYTSRVILKALGVEDFGIYNVVAGIVSFIGFINGTMVTSTTRFITYELGRGDENKLNLIFNTAFQIHSVIAVLVVVLAETVGLWFVCTHLNIPQGKFTDAVYIYQFSILSLAFSILTVPHSSLVIAHEKMSVYAYITVADVVIKLLIAWLLMLLDSHRLIFYGLFLMLSQIIQNLIYHYYCAKNYKAESRLSKCFDALILRSMFEFAGWSVFTSVSTILYTQGLNILLNVFWGPLVNASRGIAVQVQGAVSRFCQSVQTAFNPQITKSYAAEDYGYTKTLIVTSTRFSFFLLFFLSVSLFTETRYIINLWLSEVPEYVCRFIQLMLATSIIESMNNPLGTAMLATGKIRVYQTSVGIILLLIVPLSYIFLKLGYSPTVVFKVHLTITFLTLLVRLFLVRKSIGLGFRTYLCECIFIMLKPIIASCLLLWLYYKYADLPSLANIIIVHLTVFVCIFILGLKSSERQMLLNKLGILFRKAI